MALVKGSVVALISGRLGGTEFAVTRQGLVAKVAKPRAGPVTASQLAARAKLAAQGTHWRSVNSTIRTSFNQAAAATHVVDRVGVRRSLSGFQLFCQQQPDYTLIPGYPLINPVPVMTSATPYAWHGTFSASGEYVVSQTAVHDPWRFYWRIIELARFVGDDAGRTARNWIVIGTIDWSAYTATITGWVHARGIYLLEGERVGVRMTPWGYGMAKAAPLVYTAVCGA